MATIGDYLTVSSILSGFGVTALTFRIQREIEVQKKPTSDSWIARADFLILATILISSILVVLPLIIFTDPPAKVLMFARSSCSAAVVLLAGYPLAILDHYGILPGFNRKAPPIQAAPVERFIVSTCVVLSAIAFIATICFG